MTNGNITGYEVRISTTSGRITDTPTSGVLYYAVRRSDFPNDILMAQFEVRNMKQQSQDKLLIVHVLVLDKSYSFTG